VIFVADFEKEREKLLSEIPKVRLGREALELLAKLRRDFDWAIPGYRNSLSILSDTAYQDRRHFLLELIQNADDAQFESGEAEITFIVKSTGVELQYNEQGFSIEDVIAITDLGASTKSGKKLSSHRFIGEKGIGFKSVFALAKSVEIHSGPWHFRLNKDSCIIPEVLSCKNSDTPGTQLLVSFSSKETTEIVASELQRLVGDRMESFLFLQRLSKFRLIDERVTPHKDVTLTLSPASRVGKRLTVSAFPDKRQRDYALYFEDHMFPGELSRDRWERDIGPLKRRISTAALTNHEDNTSPTGLLYCYLPTEVSLPVPLYLQVDGHTTADRGRLHSPNMNKWNKHLIELLPGFLTRAILQWREDPTIATRLPDFVPSSPGNDQLWFVFKQFTDEVSKVPWIKTYDDCKQKWVCPQQAVRLTRYWAEFFTKYPKLRDKVEQAVGKCFMDPHWSTKWDEKWKLHDISQFNEQHLITLLKAISFPKAYLKADNNLVALYKELLKHLSTSSYYYRHRVKHAILNADIFPFSGGKFAKIGDQENEKVYWLSVRSQRSTGLEDAVEIRIINPKYTYRVDVNDSDTEEGREELKQRVQRNGTVRELLQELEVKEFNEDNLLELQVDWMLSTQERWEAKYRVLGAIFQTFRAKRNPQDDYLNQLARIKETILQSLQRQPHSLGSMLLPSVLRLQADDNLYVESGLPELHVPEGILLEGSSTETNDRRQAERLHRLLQDWRSFLVQCGIVVGPRFEWKETIYSDAYEFHRRNSEKYTAWRTRINFDYTAGNSVKVITVNLDNATLQLCRTCQGTHKLWGKIYSSWLEHFSSGGERLNSLTYRDNPPPGFFQTRYRRRESRSPVIQDSSWAGLGYCDVYLETIGGWLESADKCLALAVSGGEALSAAARYLPLVLEGRGAGSYHPGYLSSLKVRRPSVDDVNSLWHAEELDCKRLEIIKVALDLARAGVPMAGIKLFDLVSETLRPASEFRLGRSGASGVPLIEEQYGSEGRRLGDYLQLPMIDEKGPFRLLFEKMLDAQAPNEYESELRDLLTTWLTLSPEMQMQCNLDFSSVFCGGNTPILAINNTETYRELSAQNALVFCAEVSLDSIYQCERSAQECGFNLPADIGELQLNKGQHLTNSEAHLVCRLVRAYSSELEPFEEVNLISLFGALGGLDNAVKGIRKAASANKLLGNSVIVPVKLPYLDKKRRELVVSANLAPHQIAAHLLTAVSFAPLRYLQKEFKDIWASIEREAGHNVVTKAAAATVNDHNKNPTSVVQKVISNYVDERTPQTEKLDSEWHTSLHPEEELELRELLASSISESLAKGPESYEKRARKRAKELKLLHVDPQSIDPKAFLLSEYDGKCQLCATELSLSNGSKWIEVFRITEERGVNWWADRPFNILGLCPNCHALARHGGGRDLTGVHGLAQEVRQQNAFPIEAPLYGGDFYIAEVVINGKKQALVLSKVHMSYIAALFESVEV
jgi:hypothetical protein